MQARRGKRCAGQLQFHLLMVIAVDVAIAACPDEVADLQVALLRHHVSEQCVTGDVERNAQKDVCAALIKLATELAFATCNSRRRDIKLKKRMAGHERHFGQLGHVPSTDDDAARIWVGFQGVNHIADLVYVLTVRRGPAAPLHAVDRTQVTVSARPFVPNTHAAFFQPVVVAGTGEEPQQFNDDGFEVNFFRGDQWKALTQIETHLMAGWHW